MALYQFRPDSLFFLGISILVPLQLSTSENTITYHNALFLSLQNFARALFSISLGAILTHKRNWRQCLCKIRGDKQRAWWYVMVFSGVVNISVDKILVVMTSVETNTASLEFSGKFLWFTPHSFTLTEICPLLPQCWATRILKLWDRCNTQINVGEGKTHGRVSRLIDWRGL